MDQQGFNEDPGIDVMLGTTQRIKRVGLITPAAKEAAERRAVAMRQGEEMRRERRAQWMASLAGPGWARRGNCHTRV